MTEITPAMFTANIDTLFYLPSTTIIHKMFCLYGKGCFNKRQGHMKIVIDRANKNALLNKFSIESTIVKDDKMALEMAVSTMNAPYKLVEHTVRERSEALCTHKEARVKKFPVGIN